MRDSKLYGSQYVTTSTTTTRYPFEDEELDDRAPLALLIGICMPVVIGFIILVLICCFCRRRRNVPTPSTNNDRQPGVVYQRAPENDGMVQGGGGAYPMTTVPSNYAPYPPPTHMGPQPMNYGVMTHAVGPHGQPIPSPYPQQQGPPHPHFGGVPTFPPNQYVPNMSMPAPLGPPSHPHHSMSHSSQASSASGSAIDAMAQHQQKQQQSPYPPHHHLQPMHQQYQQPQQPVPSPHQLLTYQQVVQSMQGRDSPSQFHYMAPNFPTVPEGDSVSSPQPVSPISSAASMSQANVYQLPMAVSYAGTPTTASSPPPLPMVTCPSQSQDAGYSEEE